MGYNFDIYVDYGTDRAACRDWWLRFIDQHYPPNSAKYAKDFSTDDVEIRVYPAHATISTLQTFGAPKDSFHALLEHIRSYLAANEGCNPVGFTYASLDATTTPIVYTGGAVFITRDAAYEETAFDRLIAMQERVAKLMPEPVESKKLDDRFQVALDVRFRDAWGKATAAFDRGESFDLHSYVAADVFLIPYEHFIARHDPKVIHDRAYRELLDTLRTAVKKRAFARAYMNVFS